MAAGASMEHRSERDSSDLLRFRRLYLSPPVLDHKSQLKHRGGVRGRVWSLGSRSSRSSRNSRPYRCGRGRSNILRRWIVMRDDKARGFASHRRDFFFQTDWEKHFIWFIDKENSPGYVPTYIVKVKPSYTKKKQYISQLGTQFVIEREIFDHTV